MATGKLDLEDLDPRINKLKLTRDLVVRAKSEARETLEVGRVEQVSRNVVLEYLNDLRSVLDLGTVGEKRTFLRSFIKSVEVKNSQVTVQYSLPVPPEEGSIEPGRVLNTVQSGGAEGTIDRTFEIEFSVLK